MRAGKVIIVGAAVGLAAGVYRLANQAPDVESNRTSGTLPPASPPQTAPASTSASPNAALLSQLIPWSRSAADDRHREEVVKELARRGDAVIPELMAEYRRQGRSLSYRHDAATVLAIIRSESARKALLEITRMGPEVEEWSNQLFAATIFINTSRDRSDIAELLSSPSEEVQFNGLANLGPYPLNEEDHARVLEFARSQRPEMRWAAVRILARDPAISRMAANRAAVIEVLAHADDMKGRAVKYRDRTFMPQFNESYSVADEIRHVCIDSIARSKWENEAIRQAMAKLTDAAADSILIALARKGDPQAREDVRKLAQRPEEGLLAVWAVAAIGETGGAEDLPLLSRIAANARWKIPWGVNSDGQPQYIYPVKLAAKGAEQSINLRQPATQATTAPARATTAPVPPRQ